MTESMVERVARAILMHDYGCTPEETQKLWLGAQSTARAALDAAIPAIKRLSIGVVEEDSYDQGWNHALGKVVEMLEAGERT